MRASFRARLLNMQKRGEGAQSYLCPFPAYAMTFEENSSHV